VGGGARGGAALGATGELRSPGRERAREPCRSCCFALDRIGDRAPQSETC
jgi:hypothetical protein